MYQIKLTRPGSLESVLIDGEVTPNQVSIIIAVLKDPQLTYGEVLSFLAKRKPFIDYDAPVGAGEGVEAFRG